MADSMSTKPKEQSPVTYMPLVQPEAQPSGSTSHVSSNLKLATIFFFIAFAFHTISVVTFSLGQDSYLEVYGHREDMRIEHKFYTGKHFAQSTIGLMAASYTFGLAAFILMVLQQYDEFLKHNQVALYATFAAMVLQFFLTFAGFIFGMTNSYHEWEYIPALTVSARFTLPLVLVLLVTSGVFMVLEIAICNCQVQVKYGQNGSCCSLHIKVPGANDNVQSMYKTV